jgi:hypothetical protein
MIRAEITDLPRLASRLSARAASLAAATAENHSRRRRQDPVRWRRADLLWPLFSKGR